MEPRKNGVIPLGKTSNTTGIKNRTNDLLPEGNAVFFSFKPTGMVSQEIYHCL